MGREITDIHANAQRIASERIERNQTRLRSPTYVEERLTDGELFYRLQDYVRASIIFTDIVENYPTHRAYPDALFLLADSLFRAGDYLGARTPLPRADPRARGRGRVPALRSARPRPTDRDRDRHARLRRRRGLLRGAEPLAAERDRGGHRLLPREVSLQPRGARPRTSCASVSDDEPAPQIDQAVLDQARVGLRGASPRAAPTIRRRATSSASSTPSAGSTRRRSKPSAGCCASRATTQEQRQVIELTQLALGRLYYETDQIDQAIEAYQAVPRTSPELRRGALRDRMGVHPHGRLDPRRARPRGAHHRRSPTAASFPTATMLRGNLLLRNGRFDDAEQVFRQVRNQFGPVRRELEEMVAEHDDPRDVLPRARARQHGELQRQRVPAAAGAPLGEPRGRHGPGTRRAQRSRPGAAAGRRDLGPRAPPQRRHQRAERGQHLRRPATPSGDHGRPAQPLGAGAPRSDRHRRRLGGRQRRARLDPQPAPSHRADARRDADGRGRLPDPERSSSSAATARCRASSRTSRSS